MRQGRYAQAVTLATHRPTEPNSRTGTTGSVGLWILCLRRNIHRTTTRRAILIPLRVNNPTSHRVNSIGSLIELEQPKLVIHLRSLTTDKHATLLRCRHLNVSVSPTNQLRLDETSNTTELRWTLLITWAITRKLNRTSHQNNTSFHIHRQAS